MQLFKAYQERILDADEGATFKATGWKSADLHVHSTCSPDVLPHPGFHPESIYQTAVNRGLDYISITDHDSMDAYDLIGWEREHLVPGVEITLLDPVHVGHTIHVNVYNLNKSQFEELLAIAQKDQNIHTFTDYLKDQDLPYTYNHPFWFTTNETPNFESITHIVDLFPVIEYNMKRIRRRNMMAIWLASRFNKGILANTDTHIGEIGDVYTLAKGDTFTNYFHQIAQGNSFIVPKDMNLKNLNEEVATWLKLLFNSEGALEKELQLTEIRGVDRFINFFAQTTRKDIRWAIRGLEMLLNTVVHSGMITYFYLRNQNRMATRIKTRLQIPDSI